MILEEFDLTKQLALERKDGCIEGEQKFALLTQKLIHDSRIDDLARAATDSNFRTLLYQEYRIL